MELRHYAHRLFRISAVAVLPLILCHMASVAGPAQPAGSELAPGSYIVQASSAAAARECVAGVGGTVTAVLNVIDAVGALLSEEQVYELRNDHDGIVVYRNGKLEVSGAAAETHYPTLVGAATLHEQNITGDGITIAVIDTGLWMTRATTFTDRYRYRMKAQYDTLVDQDYGIDDDDEGDDEGDDDDGDDDDNSTWKSRSSWSGSIFGLNDWNGHGTHVTSVMMSSVKSPDGKFQGVAPDANVVAVRAFEADGSGTYLDVIEALDWVISKKDQHNIRILNLSFGAPAVSHYWDDPLNQAVMAAWQSGIIVVAAAGNGGPGPMTVGVPGNVPYIITVGAVTDSYTPNDTSDDRLAGFSAAGPTVEGFVKPELLAPGGHMLGQMPPYAWLPLEYPEFVQPVDDYFTMSGTSQSAAVVSGVLALMLQADPDLAPNEAKCRLMASAKAGQHVDGSHTYSVFQQGAGLVDAQAAVNESAFDCANLGMNIDLDLAGGEHYAGPAGVDENGTYYLVDGTGTRLTGPGFEWMQGLLWPEGSFWQRGPVTYTGTMWNQGEAWNPASSPSNSDSLLNQGILWPEGVLWPEGPLKTGVSTSVWVNQE